MVTLMKVIARLKQQAAGNFIVLALATLARL